MTLGLLVLPLAIALAVWLIRRARILALPISAAACIGYGIVVAGARRVEPIYILGRAVSLTARDSVQLCIMAFCLAFVLIYACRLPQGDMAGPLTLMALGLFGAAMMVRSHSIAALLLTGGAVGAAMLAPASGRNASMAASRALTMLVIGGIVLVVGATAMEGSGTADAHLPPPRVGAMTVVAALSVLMAMFPFFMWLPAMFDRAGPLAAVALSVGLGSAAIARFGDLQQWAEPLIQMSIADMLLIVGLASVVAMSLAAAVQTGVSRALAYAAMADMGIVLVGIGLHAQQASGAAMLHLALRNLAVVLAAMSAGVLKHCFGSDVRDAVQGAAHRAPVAVFGLAVAGLALAGLPPGAGFASRFGLYEAVSQRLPAAAAVLALSSLGPAWAIGRSVVATLSALPLAGSRREPVLPGILIAILGLGLLALGLMPQLLASLPAQWFEILIPVSVGS